MKKLKMKSVVTAVVLGIGVLVTAVVAEPGSGADPLISKSYIENILIPQIEDMIDARMAENGNTEDGDAVKGSVFGVVEVKKGKEVICSAGTELILRMGSASVIATEKGGLADTTSGYDLADGMHMPANHLLIVPVADGRGVKAETDIILMIKGDYSVK